MYPENREEIPEDVVDDDIVFIADDNASEVICLDSDEDDWPIEVLDKYIDFIPKKKTTKTPPVKQEKVDLQEDVLQYIKKERFKFETSIKPIIKREIENEAKAQVSKKIKTDNLPVEKEEENGNVQERKCLDFNFPKKPKIEKDSAKTTMAEAINSITEKFNTHRKTETVKSKAMIICMHLHSVEEKYRSMLKYQAS